MANRTYKIIYNDDDNVKQTCEARLRNSNIFTAEKHLNKHGIKKPVILKVKRIESQYHKRKMGKL